MVGYALLLALPVLILGTVLTRSLGYEADRAALAAGILQAQTISRTAVDPVLENRDLTHGLLRRERLALVSTIKPILESGTVDRVRIRDRDGWIMFDVSNPSEPPEKGDRNDIVKTAASGQLTSNRRMVTVSGLETTRSVEVIEVMMAIQPGGPKGRVNGVLEISMPYEPIAANRNAFAGRIYLALFVSLLCLWALLATIVWSMTKRIRRDSAHNRHLSLHDHLTGLPNRALFNDRAHQALQSAARTTKPVTIAIVDLDRFKEVNDTLGHDVGDRLLVAVADRMRRHLRTGDTAARLGGDEFGIVLPATGKEEAAAILNRLHDALREELDLDDVTVRPGSSVGWSEWPQHGTDLQQLLRVADQALYKAKEFGCRVVRYEHSSLSGSLSELCEARKKRQQPGVYPACDEVSNDRGLRISHSVSTGL